MGGRKNLILGEAVSSKVRFLGEKFFGPRVVSR